MNCPNCHDTVVEMAELFFYHKKEKDVHLSIKPEQLEMVLARKTLYKERETPKKLRVKCNKCFHNLGVEVPFGPQGSKFIAFACDKVKLKGTKFTKKHRWWQIYITLGGIIETRDTSTFFDVLSPSQPVEKKETREMDCTIKFPSLDNLNDFEWISVSLDKKPRKYQIEAFVEVLQRNLVVVIKTGAGKTLVASMFLARMCNLNPSKMGLMIVDRIPLVFQQGDAIRKDTNLRVVSICGENKTEYKVKQLNSNHFDIMVITAGAFYEMVVGKKELDVNRFCAVVLDECHHVTGSHRYVDVLGLFTDKRLDLQPRILGLTASPVNAKTLEQADKNLEKFLSKFPLKTKIFFPNLPKLDTTTEEKCFCRTNDQVEFIQHCIDKFQEIVQCISGIIGIKDIPVLQENLLNKNMIVGILRSLGSEFSEYYANLQDMITDALLLLEVVVLCDVMGILYGFMKLNDGMKQRFADFLLKFQDNADPSPRLYDLHQTLEKLSPDSKTLIFVSTRQLAAVLTHHLQVTFPHMKIEKIVGHNGYDGMAWEDDQERRIKDFAGDQCNLLVCTSVLEEGIDVESCDLVVCFTGIRSLITFIQARGRGRKQGSRFIVYQSKEESERNRNRHLEENIMQTVLRENQNASCYFTNMTKDIVSKIEAEMNSDELGSLEDKSFQVLRNGEIDFSFLVYLDVSALKIIVCSDIKSKLTEMLNEIQVFKLNRLEIICEEINSKSTEAKIFPKETIIFLVGVQCIGHVNPVQCYRAFCRMFPYHMEFDNGGKCYMWTRMKLQEAEINEIEISIIPVRSFQLGYFKNMINYGVGYNNVHFDDVKIFFDRKDIRLSFNEGNGIYEVYIPKPLIGNFMVISLERHSFTLAFCLSACPVIFLNNERITNFNNDDACEAFENYPLLLINIENNLLDDVTNMINKMIPVPCFNITLEEENSKEIVDVPEVSNKHDILWSLNCLEDSRTMIYLPDTPIRLFKMFACKSIEQRKFIQRVVHKCCLPYDRPYFESFERIFNDTYAAFQQIPTTRRFILDEVVPKDHFLVRRAIVTPLRIVSLHAVPVTSSRLLRRLGNTIYRLIIVSFKEENCSKQQNCSKNVLLKYKAIMADGLVINELKYNFLLSTGSQLREHKAYFIAASYEEVLSIRHEIIPPNCNNFTSPAKYLTRLGIYGTGDKKVGQLSSDKVNIIDDLNAASGEFVTDGAGKIAMTKAKDVATFLGMNHVIPSAFQVRYSGIKGILVTTPDEDSDLQGREIAIRRQTMVKFYNNDLDFCVSKTATLVKFTLNREIITLLSSIPVSWQLDKTLLDYQETALSKYAEMFNNIYTAWSELRNFIPSQCVDMLECCAMELLDEKYWISILQGIYRLRCREIRTKTSIPVEQSCLVIGVPDPVGVLKEDEVFLQLEDGGVMKGPLLMFRNPCLHPGDVQRVTGVDQNQLMHLLNVVVLPVKGCKRSLAASCSGGDLDGDQYAVIWDENFIPPKEFMYPPCDYRKLAEEASQNSSNNDVDVENQENLAAFFEKVMSNDSLGRVAHKHLALCDILEKGARDPLAVKLAESQAQAVDFPKTGIIPLVPKAALSEVQHFPDFMEKSLSETKPSKKILGVLYRRCRSLTYDFDVGLHGSPNFLPNMNLLVEGNENYLKSAVDVYVNYAHDMEMLIRRFELKAEADIILGHATFRWSQHLEADKGKATNAIVASYEAITHKYRQIFYEDVDNQKSIREKASAWYRIVNDPKIKITRRKKNRKVFRSFPWIVYDILCNIRKENDREQQSRRLTNIGETSLAFFKKNSRQLLHIITEKLRKMKEIEEAVDRYTEKTYGINKAFFVFAYGSTSIYVCEAESDIDVCIFPKPKTFKSKIIPGNCKEFSKLEPQSQQKHFLRVVVSRAIDKICEEKREVFDAPVPIVKCSFKDGEKPIYCDISMNEEGYRKTMYIHQLFADKKYGACYLLLFWILVRWARISGIVRSVLNSDKQIDTAEFYALIIHVLDFPSFQVQNGGEISQPNRWSGIKYLYQKLDQFGLQQYYRLGKMLFDFFRKVSTLKDENLKIVWPVSGIHRKVNIPEPKVSIIKALAGQAYHALSATRDVNAMLNYFLVISTESSQEFRRVLPLSVSYAIGNACSFHATRLSEITGAVVTIEVEKGKCNLVVYAEGTRIALENLQNELRSLQRTNKALVLGRLPQKSSRYFMEGSSIFIVRKTSSVASILSFEDSHGAYELHHHASQRSSVFLYSNVNEEEDGNNWKDTACERLRDHVVKQLHMFPANNDVLLKNFEVTTRFGCFYLVDIEKRLPDAQNTLQIQEVQVAVEKGRRSRKKWQRSEFKMDYSEYGLEDHSSTTSQMPSFEMVSLPVGKRNCDKNKIKKNLYKNKKRKRGITAAFTPGLFKNNTADQNAHKSLLSCYHTVLKNCGFYEGQTTNRRQSPTWKVSLNPSASYEVQLNLDNELKVLKVAERPLNWIHGTILDGRKQEFNRNLCKNPDIRLLFATQDVVREGCDLYHRVLPEGNLPFYVVDGRPVVSGNSHTGTATKKRHRNNKDFVSMIRHVQTIQVFTNGVIDACVVCGVIYFGSQLSLSRPFCELSLYYDSSPIIASIENNFAADPNNEEDCLKNYIQNIFDTSLFIKEELDEVLKQLT